MPKVPLDHSQATVGNLSRRRVQDRDATVSPARNGASAVEWTFLRELRLNAVIHGARMLTDVAVARLSPALGRPLVRWNAAQFSLADLRRVTLVVPDADSLDPHQQEHLLHFTMLPQQPIQILALATSRLYNQVACGRFSSTLYYRLNGVVIELESAADLPPLPGRPR